MLSRRAITLVVTATFLLACGENTDTPSSTSEAEYVEQEVEERSFNDWILEDVRFDKSVSIGDVMRLRIFNDRIFVIDRAHFNVKRYAQTGELEAVYGNGQGQAPGQFQNINSFWVDEENGVWIVDLHSQAVSRFQSDGTFVERFRTDFPPHRIAAVRDNRLVFHMLSQPEVFALTDKEGNVLERFGQIIDESQTRYNFALNAQMYPHPDGGFIWAPVFASYLYFYGPGGNLKRRIELIDGHPFPLDEMQPNPMQTTARDIAQPHRTFGVSISDEAIFVNVLEDRSDATVVDRYDRATGQYLDSFRLPAGGGRYHVHDGMVYGEADTTLRAYRIHRSP